MVGLHPIQESIMFLFFFMLVAKVAVGDRLVVYMEDGPVGGSGEGETTL